MINKQNYCHLAQDYPQWLFELTQYPQNVNVWCVTIANRILGTYFFYDILQADRYLDFLMFPNGNYPSLANTDAAE